MTLEGSPARPRFLVVAAMCLAPLVILASCGVPTDPSPVALDFKAPPTVPQVPTGRDAIPVYFVQDGKLLRITRYKHLPSKADVPRGRLSVVPSGNLKGPTTTVLQDEPLADWNKRIVDAQHQAIIDTLVDGLTTEEKAQGLSSSLEAVGLGAARQPPVVFSRLDRGIAYLVFGDTFKLEGTTGDDFRLALSQLVYTVTELTSVGQVVFEQVVSGGIKFVNIQNAQGVGLDAGTPLSRQDFAEYLTDVGASPV